ncbi:MAG: undecaprenyl/decaprenyl-phosphate alpha-N-acetylglucosaminyl 1-phosphate transferase [Bacteroidales bacterium]|jgi:UDP-N-acetylmuramyl pentapeptide phosphotransferase/UDP-N-acetylglucosamine-1-phosphate transferase|nr:undecaprenyl/decaprenyl-phosphate alpha-N-acetylglucosaminyl 1-phosphate transferase [Bacteroidales bacterium]
MITSIIICLICVVSACAFATYLNPKLVDIAYDKNLLDSPSTRKLQKKPVPVIGGISVYLAAIAAAALCNLFIPTNQLYMAMAAISLIFFVGLLDDLTDLSPKKKFICQISLVVLLYFTNTYKIDNMNGVFGIYDLPLWASLSLSLLTGVGLMNAINMIDGVDGLSSGYGICFCLFCGSFFLVYDDIVNAMFAFTFVGSLIPFFICNVFSEKYKMFIGDSGSLVMGMLAYVFCCTLLKESGTAVDSKNVSLALTVFAVPIFDTLRVMTMRIVHGGSPFKADRTHLHHIFVSLNMPHIFITLFILLIEVIIVGVWMLLFYINLDVTVHTVLIIILCATIVWGVYVYLNYVRVHNPNRFNRYADRIQRIRKKPDHFMVRISNWLDNPNKLRKIIDRI